jgi:GTP cyclohydrolase II
LMPDVLHWLGITRIDRLVSMSDMKYKAITQSGIQVIQRVPIPTDLIPADARVEIEAKKAAGYYTEDDVLTEESLANIRGRELIE